MATKKTTKKTKFKFISDYKYLYAEGCQFLKGEFETENEEVAEKLRQYPQIKEAKGD
ncbi:hypothetical protein SAMN05661008_00335 [Alkalithermobacter thermoalcaliphilus JW-YL-7 = DSM 7308]|uniref:Uncharacterized protein n=1 Tax=Alkalithermobacter thermoalcaliphilus JW-YL-7 = DSM 7308 TaxID=1121328 RepID=A0A150FPD6_CLOPD|nr:hypothetical protein JWYL7_0554 [[Clostridium] paradoxum JW-YL-7 = DSM 7308]SHK50146.1 hypothetical protein SAMN05661008_00335 [[Clostridium] paradoxum JW-YL-7 = DSM 7308]